MRYTEEQMDAHIESMTQEFGNANVAYPSRLDWQKAGFKKPPYCKVKVGVCEHCETLMSTTGRMPAKTDRASWFHWFGFRTDGEGLHKIHTLSPLQATCVPCYEFYNNDEGDEQ